MSTITLPNIRVGSDLQVRVRLKDGGVAIDWSTLQNIKAYVYSDAQRAMAGRCTTSVDGDDPTLLVCNYAATKPQYLGANRIIVSCSYMGETKTYDKPAFTYVRWTDDQDGEEIQIDDPDIDVEIEVQDVTSSILDEAVQAALSAAERADEAAAAAEHMVDIHTGPQGPVGATPNITVGTVTTVEPGTPAAASMGGTPEAPVLNLSIPKGAVGATPNFTVGTVTTGQPGTPVVVTITGTPEAPVLNVTIPQGMQGNTGSSVDYPYELVNNLTTNDPTKGLSAAQGVVLEGEISQLGAKVTPSKTYFVGAKNTYAKNLSTASVPAKPGRVYRLTPFVKEWSHGTVTSTSTFFGAGYLSGNTENLLLTLSGWNFRDYYDITIPDNAPDGSLILIGGRADSGVVVEFMVADVTDAARVSESVQIYRYGTIPTLGTGNNAMDYFAVNGGGQYKVTISPYTKSLLTKTLKFQLAYYPNMNNLDDSTIVLITQIDNTLTEDVDVSAMDFYIEVPDRAMVRLVIRGDEGQNVNYKVENVSYEETVAGHERFYDGETIRVYGNKGVYKDRIYSVAGIARYNSKTNQSIAIYGDYAFLTYDTGYIQVLRLSDYTIVGAYAMPEGVQVENNHAGMANFAKVFYDSGDDFPLLYVSSYLENKCYVLRVTTSSCSLVQTITMANAWHFITDDDDNLIVHMNDWSTYNIFDLPDISQSEVTLTDSGKKDTFQFPTPGMYTAGAFCQDGRMYILCYYIATHEGGKFDNMTVYDYRKKKVVSKIVFENPEIRETEFEGISPDSYGTIYISFIANKLARLVF